VTRPAPRPARRVSAGAVLADLFRRTRCARRRYPTRCPICRATFNGQEPTR
jgi:hypothetical protein